MRNSSQKLRLILVPFVIIAICVIAGYTFLNWVLFIKTRAFSLNEEVVNIWIPLALPWIPMLIWLLPRIKLLNLKRKKTDLPGLYLMIAGFAIAVPTCIAQSYLQTASGKLTRLTNIEQIGKYEETKYYTLGKFYIDKAHVGVQTSFEVTGKHSQNLNMNLYVVLPILSSEEDTLKARCLAWYGIKYHEQISNRLDKEEKEARYQTFANTSQADFDRKDVNQFVYLDRIGNTDDHKEYITAVKNNKTFSAGGATILVPVNEAFEARNGSKLGWIFGALAIGMTIWSIMVAIPKFDDAALEKFENGVVERSDSPREFWSFFLPREGFFITPVIIDLNILVFIIMVFAGLGFVSFKGDDLLAWGANFRPATSHGQWWRLVTSTFLHGGIMHLLANMYGLLFVGIFLEPRLGKIRFAMVYLITGILASIASLWWHAATVSVGASGAIFGLYGAFLALLLMKVFPKDFSKVFLGSTLIFVGFNLVMGFTGGIDNAAHLGGLISGFVIGLILSPGLRRETEFG